MKNYLLYIFILSAILLNCACADENFSNNPADKLSFSTDTLSFDSVFTTVGSATEVIKIYNPHKKSLKINRIWLDKGATSDFKINVDGFTSKDFSFNDLEIAPRDSMYIFVTVNAAENAVNMPVLLDDNLHFSTNGNLQSIHLQAIGQNMEMLRNRFIFSDSTLTAEKPYIIFDTLLIVEGKTLTIEAGAKLYFHKNACLIVLGNLQAQGTLQKPIEMRGDRLDKIRFSDFPVPYNYIAGQWTGIFLLGNSGNHLLENVKINSADVGIYFYNSDRNHLPDLTLKNCRLHNFSLYGIVAVNGNLTATNTEISNSSAYCAYLEGGEHTFVHCTIANFFNGGYQSSSRTGEAAVMIYNIDHEARMKTVFKNCVISGSATNELTLLTNFVQQYNGEFSHSYIKRTDTVSFPQFTDIRWFNTKDTLFKQPTYDLKKDLYFDFSLDSVSPARGIADPAVTVFYGLQLDINGHDRTTDGAPDAGAYEFRGKE